MSSIKRPAAIAAAAAAVLIPATAASAQETKIPEEGWQYSENWDFVRDEYTAEAQAETDELLAEHFEEWSFDNSLEMVRLQNYYIDSSDESLVQRKFRADFYVDQTGEGLETALYLPGGIATGIAYPDEVGGFEDGHLLHCADDDIVCEETELEDGTLVAWTGDGTYVEAGVFHTDGTVATVWWGSFGDDLQVSPEQIVDLAVDLDTAPVWDALEADSEA